MGFTKTVAIGMLAVSGAFGAVAGCEFAGTVSTMMDNPTLKGEADECIASKQVGCSDDGAKMVTGLKSIAGHVNTSGTFLIGGLIAGGLHMLTRKRS